MKKLVGFFFKLPLNSSLGSSKAALVGLSWTGDKGDDLLTRRGMKPSALPALGMALRPRSGFSLGTSSSKGLSHRSS